MATVSKSHSKLEFCGEPGTVGYVLHCSVSYCRIPRCYYVQIKDMHEALEWQPQR